MTRTKLTVSHCPDSVSPQSSPESYSFLGYNSKAYPPYFFIFSFCFIVFTISYMILWSHHFCPILFPSNSSPFPFFSINDGFLFIIVTNTYSCIHTEIQPPKSISAFQTLFLIPFFSKILRFRTDTVKPYLSLMRGFPCVIFETYIFITVSYLKCNVKSFKGSFLIEA